MSQFLNREAVDISLLDEEFLAALSEQKEREIYAKIIALDINELPIDEIEGRVTGGSINIDGTSAVQRTCSLTLVSDEVDINDYYWGIKTKFKLEIGLKNNLIGDYAATADYGYPDIVWFKQGVFFITAFNTSITTNSCTITLSGKDKMCMLNGELGGQLFASIDFGTEEVEEKVMIAASITANSSEGLMENEYYKKYALGENTDVVIAATDTQYAFVTDAEGSFYKSDNKYRLIESLNLENDEEYTGRRYTCYQLIQHPSELFTEITDFKKDATYKKISDDEPYYVLAKSETDYGKHSSTDDNKLYELETLYEASFEYVINKIPLEQIIREAVHTYAQEPYHNIIINDLEEYGLEQLTYKGDTPLYALRIAGGDIAYQLVRADQNESLQEIVESSNFQTDTLTDALSGTSTNSTPVYWNTTQGKWVLERPDVQSTKYTVAKLEYGDDIGYRITDLTYPGDLISSVGENLTSILDKIKTMLGNFEYFYDVNGRFIFQRKRTYVDTVWSQLVQDSESDDQYVDYVNSDRRKFSFNFEGNRLITAIQNNPTLTNLKNDFVVWGKRTSASGAEIPIHARYAIDVKPQVYRALNGRIYVSNDVDLKKALANFVDIDTSNLINQSIDSERLEAIRNFNVDNMYIPDYLIKPVKQADNTEEPFSPGWWDIDVWAEYYSLLIGKTPHGTMKFYSRNNAAGRQSCSEITELSSRSGDVWLIQVREGENHTLLGINTGHGSGIYNEDRAYSCNYYRTVVDEDDQYIIDPTITNSIQITAGGTTIQLERMDASLSIHAPYFGCADIHTYDYFKLTDAAYGWKTYFYNPTFPSVEMPGGYAEAYAQAVNAAVTEFQNQNQHLIIQVDWREIIYQMALDYYAGQGCSEDNPIYNLANELVIDNPDHFLFKVGELNEAFYPTGYTGYEQYYTDLQGFWRSLYNPFYTPQAIWSIGEYVNKVEQISGSRYYTKLKDWQESQIIDCNIQYYFITGTDNIDRNSIAEDSKTDITKNLTRYGVDASDARLYWNINVFEDPEGLDFWFDFLDGGTELQQFSVPIAGDRTKVINADKASAIVFRDVPPFIVYDKDEQDVEELKRRRQLESAYVFIQLQKGYSQYFTISYRSTSVKNKIDELLYNYAYCIENITITALPVYYLEPNTRIYVQDKTTNIEGEYLVSKITIPLTYNGTMTINATKAPNRLY